MLFCIIILTKVNGCQSNACCIFTIALFKQHHFERPPLSLRGVEVGEAPSVGPQLLHCSRPERVTAGDQDTETVLQQPESQLMIIMINTELNKHFLLAQLYICKHRL